MVATTHLPPSAAAGGGADHKGRKGNAIGFVGTSGSRSSRGMIAFYYGMTGYACVVYYRDPEFFRRRPEVVSHDVAEHGARPPQGPDWHDDRSARGLV